jgi:hypothetical protein
MGRQLTLPNATGVMGYPANGDANYAGLCSFACNYGYCPSSAAAPPKSPLISPQHRHSIRPRVLGVMVMVVLQAFAALLATMDTALFILVLAPPPGP